MASDNPQVGSAESLAEMTQHNGTGQVLGDPDLVAIPDPSSFPPIASCGSPGFRG